MRGPQPLPCLSDIVPYKGGETLKGAVKLSSNENPLGCSPAAITAVREASLGLALYPDGSAKALREALATRFGLHADRIVVGSGSDEIFQLLARAYLRPGDEIIQSEHGFLVYRLVAQQSGAITISAPDRDYTADVDAILERVTPRTRIVFLANPNNPTGTCIPFEDIQRLHKGLREDILLVLDGAYAEYVRRNDYSAGTELAGSSPNVMVTRTFSKVYGLAALRLGWGYGPESVIDALHRVRGPFNTSAIAQAAGIAALADHAFVEESVSLNNTERDRLAPALSALGFQVTPSEGNFLLVHFGTDPARGAAAADAFLRSRGLVVRAMGAYGLPGALRLSIGLPVHNEAMLSALSDFAKAA